MNYITAVINELPTKHWALDPLQTWLVKDVRINLSTLCDRRNQQIDHHWIFSIGLEACDHLTAYQEILPQLPNAVELSSGIESSFSSEGARAGDEPTDLRLPR